MDPARWEQATVVDRVAWAPGLVTFTLDRVRDFAAGQFTLLARPDATARRGALQRAYSIASPPGAPLAFLVVEVPGGALSPWLVSRRVGEPVWVGRRTTGRFTLDRVPSAPVLWLLATGTGLAPFLSMVEDGAVFERFGEVVLVHGVRHASAFANRARLRALASERPLSLVGVCSREVVPGALYGRIPARLADGEIGRAAGVDLDPAGHQVMLCGNPAMIDQLTGELGVRGMRRPSVDHPGQVHAERYW